MQGRRVEFSTRCGAGMGGHTRDAGGKTEKGLWRFLGEEAAHWAAAEIEAGRNE